jgi:hypothetical protein
MTARTWLRHAAATIRPPTCHTRLDLFTTRDLAHAALMHGLGHHGLTPTPCTHGARGWHNVSPTETRRKT